MIQLKVAAGCGPTAKLLQQLVSGGHAAKTGVVCWGRGHNGPEPSLNRRAGVLNKLQQLQKFKEGGVPTLEFFEQLPSAAESFPLLGRRFSHHGGKDICLILQPEDISMFRPRPDFFTRYVPRATEYRSWIYRRRHLCTYEKRLIRPEERRVGRPGANYRHGYAFMLMNSVAVPEDLRDISSRAVEVLDLDFGAVDLLRGVDGGLYVLEVNTAPGQESADRLGLKSLAAKIKKWEELGFPRRNGDKVDG